MRYIPTKPIPLICCICLFIFTGSCAEQNGGITLSVGGAPSELDFWESLVDQFEHETHIRVNLLRQPTDTDQRRQGLVIALEARKNNPDVFLMDVVWIAQFAASGWLESLDSYVKRDELSLAPFFPTVLNLADRYRAQLIALPLYIDGGLLYYRADLLTQEGILGPPQTWRQLIENAVQVQKRMRKTLPHFYGFVWQGAQYEGLVCNFEEVAGSNGGGISLTDGRVLLNTPENIEAVQLMHDMIYKYKISPLSTYTEMREEPVRQAFQQGNALFERNWPYAWALHQAPDSSVRGKTAIAALPHFPSKKSVSSLGGWHVGMSKFSDQKELSWQLIRFLTSYETQKKLALELGWNPGRKDIYNDPEVLKRMPHLSALAQVFENARPRPTLPYYTQLSEVIQRYLNAALSGKLTPADALAAAEKEAQEIVDRYEIR